MLSSQFVSSARQIETTNSVAQLQFYKDVTFNSRMLNMWNLMHAGGTKTKTKCTTDVARGPQCNLANSGEPAIPQNYYRMPMHFALTALYWSDRSSMKQ